MRIAFTLPLEPVAKGRPRFTRSGRCYTPKETERFEEQVRMLARPYSPRELLDGPLMLTARFIMVPPKRPRFKWPAVKPDTDNFLKGLMDSLNGIIWTDDARVCLYGHGTGKYYDWSPNPKSRIEVEVQSLDEKGEH